MSKRTIQFLTQIDLKQQYPCDVSPSFKKTESLVVQFKVDRLQIIVVAKKHISTCRYVSFA